MTAATEAPLAERQAEREEVDRGRSDDHGQPRGGRLVAVHIDLTNEPILHSRRNVLVVVVSTLFFGLLTAAKIRLFDWYTTATSDSVRMRVVIVHAISVLALTPLVVGVFLTLPTLVARLLRRLRQDDVVVPAQANASLDERAEDLQHRLNRVRVLVLLPTVLYLAYLLGDTLVKHDSWQEMRLLDLQKLPLRPLPAVLLVLTLLAQAVVFYVAVTALSELWSSSQAFGRLLRDPRFKIQVQPRHPDGSGGLRPIGRLLNLVLHVAAILGIAGVGIFLALHGTPWIATRRPEPYVLAGFYIVLLPSAFTLLWRPHVLMDQRRDEILKPVASVLNATISGVKPKLGDGAEQLKAKNDRLEELSRELKLLDDAFPAWPLRLRRLRPVVATAVLPVVIPVLVAIMSKLMTG
jgi:hypothetical protein